MTTPGPVVDGVSVPTLAKPSGATERQFFDRGPYTTQAITKRAPDILDYYLDLARILEPGESVTAVTGQVADGDNLEITEINFGPRLIQVWLQNSPVDTEIGLSLEYTTSEGRHKQVVFRVVAATVRATFYPDAPVLQPYADSLTRLSAITPGAFGLTLLDDITQAAARVTLGLVPGTDVAIQRTLTPGAGVAITNGNGLAGNPVVALTAPTIASLALANTALQPGSVATVALTGAYADLTGKPTLGTAAAAAISDFATAAQGVLAGTAVQPARAVNTGAGLTGGGSLAADRTIALSAGTIASLASADSALQPAAIGVTVQGYSASLTALAAIAPGATGLALLADVTAGSARTTIGLGNVDNTSDLAKPISTATQTALDGKVDENSAITGATKTKVTYDAKGLVTGGADATTADISDSSNRRYVTDANLVVIGNTSGVNTGDQTLGSYGLTASPTELNYVDGVTGPIQTQIDGRLVIASNLSDLASPSTARTNLGLGSIATQAASAVAITGGSASIDTLIAKASSSSEGGEIQLQRASGSGMGGNLVIDQQGNSLRIFDNDGVFNRGVTLDMTTAPLGSAGATILHSALIGSTIQAFSSTLTTLAAVALGTLGLALLDDSTAADGRATLGLGTAAVMAGPSSTIVGINDTQTLTGKTIAAGSNTISGLANANLSGAAGITAANLATAVQTSLGLADTSVQPARAISAGTGLTGGGSLAADRTLALSAGSIASLALADGSAQKASNLSDLANAATARTNLGVAIGVNVQAYSANLSTFAGIAPAANVVTFLGAANYAAMRTALGVAIGTDVQAYSANLGTLAAVTPGALGLALLDDTTAAAGRTTLGVVIGTDVQAYNANLTTYAGVTPGAFALTLLDDTTQAAARTTLALTPGTDVAIQRTLTGPAAGLSITNGSGVAGNPTIALANDLAALEALTGTSTIYYRSGTDTWTAVTVGGNLGFTGGTLGSALGTAATMAGPASTIVGISDAQTLTNKTLTSPTINAAALSGTLSGTPTFSGNLTMTGGVIDLGGASSNFIIYNVNGVAAPTLTTRSAGTKIVLYPSLSGSLVDYAIGIESGTLWNSVGNTSAQFKWYGGTTLAATLSGAGVLTTVGQVNAPTVYATSALYSATVELAISGNYARIKPSFANNNGYGLIHRHDGGAYYILVTALNDASGSWTAARPFTIDLATGILNIGASSTMNSVPIVGTTLSQTLTNKTLTAPVIATIVNTGTLTLPTSTDTLVGRATTDTLTNKTLTTPTINGAALSGTVSGTPTFSGNITMTGGVLNMSGASNNAIVYNTNGVAAPSFTTRSVGAKVVLYPSLTGATTDYAIGIEGAALWTGVESTSASFKWYGGTTLAATLTGLGALAVVDTVYAPNGYIVAQRDDISTRVGSGFFQTNTGTTAEGWPLNDGNWQYIFSNTHSNTGNYFSLQLGGSFFDQRLYFRNVNNNGATAWTNLTHVTQTGTNAGERTFTSKAIARVNVSDFAGTDQQALERARDAAVANTWVQLVLEKQYSVSTSIDFPKGVDLVFEKGGSLTVASGQVVTIRGKVTAPAKRIFYGSGTVVGLRENVVEWWGADPTETNDSSGAIQAALNSMRAASTGGAGAANNSDGDRAVVKLNGTYRLTSPIEMTVTENKDGFITGTGGIGSLQSRLVIRHNGAYGLKITGAATDQNASWGLENFGIIRASGFTCPIGIQIGGDSGKFISSWGVKNRVSWVQVTDFPTGWDISGVERIKFDNCGGDAENVSGGIAVHVRSYANSGFTGDLDFETCLFKAPRTTGACFKITCSHTGAVVKGISIYGGTTIYYGLYMLDIATTGTSTSIGDVYLNLVRFDGKVTDNHHGIRLRAASGTVIQGFGILGSYIAGFPTGYLAFDADNSAGGGRIAGVQIQGNRFYIAFDRTILMDTIEDADISHNKFEQCGTVSPVAAANEIVKLNNGTYTAIGNTLKNAGGERAVHFITVGSGVTANSVIYPNYGVSPDVTGTLVDDLRSSHSVQLAAGLTHSNVGLAITGDLGITGSFKIGGVLAHAISGGYSLVFDPAGAEVFSANTTNSNYRGNTHEYYSRNGLTNYGSWGSSGLSVLGDATAKSLIVSGGGTYAAGCLYSDSNYGMLIRAKVTGAVASVAFLNAAGTQLASFTNGGNFGIGVTASYKLEVDGDIGVRAALRLLRVATQEIQFDGGSSKRWRWISTINGATDGDMILQHTTDGYVSNFVNALSIGPTGAITTTGGLTVATYGIFDSTGLYVNGAVNVPSTGSYQIAGFNIISRASGFTRISDIGGNVGIAIGFTTGTPNNFYQADVHYFYDRAGTTSYAQISSAGMNVNAFLINGVNAFTLTSSYIVVRNNAGVDCIALGPAGTPNNYYSADEHYFRSRNAATGYVRIGNAFVLPVTDNAFQLGGGSNRWTTVYATTGTINTSDARQKTEFSLIPENVMQSARELMGKIGVYQWLDAVAIKGGAARFHVGLKAQDVLATFWKNEADASRYALFCNDNGVLGLRPDQVKFLMIANLHLRQETSEEKIARLEARVAELEAA